MGVQPVHPSTKQELRNIYREKRANLSTGEFRQLNDRLMVQVKALEVHREWTVHLFLPIEGSNEPDMYAVAAWLRGQYPGIRLVIPKTERGSHRLSHIVWDADTTLEANHWGIPEPVTGTMVLPQEIDAVFVPLLVVDEQGHRVGYGKGFYDRFLAACRPDTRKIGVSLFEPVKAIADVSPLDVALDMCITPRQILSF